MMRNGKAMLGEQIYYNLGEQGWEAGDRSLWKRFLQRMGMLKAVPYQPHSCGDSGTLSQLVAWRHDRYWRPGVSLQTGLKIL